MSTNDMQKPGLKRTKLAAHFPLTLDATTGEPIRPHPRGEVVRPTGDGGKVRRMRLRSLEDVERELERLVREVRSGKVSTEAGTKLTYMLRTLGEFKVIATLKQRVLALEGRLAGGAGVDDDDLAGGSEPEGAGS